MKNIILGITLFSFPLFASAKLNLVSELLIGKAQNNVHSTFLTEKLEGYYTASLQSDSFGFRLGTNVNEYLSFELAKHKHGDTMNEVKIPVQNLPGMPNSSGPVYSYSEIDVKIPMELESIRLGVKGKIDLFTNTSINTRFGVANWKYDNFTPRHLLNLRRSSGDKERGNDFYYAIGAEYKFNESFYLGFEYSLLKINERIKDKSFMYGSYTHDVKDLSLVLGWAF
ncbi:outer membrane beta-barrel protein [Pseudoalteromonas spongiae]|uniref:Outer membrane beta-barrel protein n=1 Tax=Pseudoalteromonas spongiae TaxID=298657 RepID=A0ABU8EVR7_9GAMM